MWNVQLQTFFKILYVRLIKANTVVSILIRNLVGQYLRGCLLLCDLLHQTFHPASVSSNLRTDQERQYFYLSRGTYLQLEQLGFLCCNGDI